MSDFLSVQPVSGLGNAVRPDPQPPPPPVAKPIDSGSSRSATEYDQARKPQADAPRRRDIERQARFDKKTLTDPPPAFEASLLEVEANLEAVMRRLEAARERARADESGATAPHQVSKPADQVRTEAPVKASDEASVPATDHGHADTNPAVPSEAPEKPVVQDTLA